MAKTTNKILRIKQPPIRIKKAAHIVASFRRLAAEHLLEPLGITEYEWDFIDEDTVHALSTPSAR